MYDVAATGAATAAAGFGEKIQPSYADGIFGCCMCSLRSVLGTRNELPEFWLCYVESHLYKPPAVLYNLCVCIGEEAREVAKEVEGFTAAINGVLIFGN
ncbi:hypothetical protein V9T40_004486 [Parthenolecanium corni]|uniref:Uncharacterized protein n=1 Tax=Parthenolecanium corni TaxID=536013 RepID=A0AAN9TU42_9HEMI